MRLASTRTLGLAATALALAGVVGFAQIERLDLRQMITKTDNAVVGTIKDSEVIVIDHEIDGDDLYYTHLTIEGKSLIDGAPLTVVVTYPGGWIDAENGVDNSEAPAADEVAIGNEVVAFYKWSPNMGGDLAANALYASHGGIYQVANGRKGKVVLGKAEGYAISSNSTLAALDAQITSIYNDLRESGQK